MIETRSSLPRDLRTALGPRKGSHPSVHTSALPRDVRFGSHTLAVDTRSIPSEASLDHCTYCYRSPADTRDHVPPKNLFPRPLPNNLITVPCCKPCNTQLARDDDYFWHALMTASNIEQRSAASESRARALRGLGRPEAQGLLSSIISSFQRVELQSPGGIYIGHAPAFQVDNQRIKRVLARIVRALYFTVNRALIPAHNDVHVWWNQFEFPKFIRELATEAKTTWPGPYDIGPHIFSFTWLQTPGPVPRGVWLMTFYESFCGYGFVARKQTTGPQQEQHSDPG